MKDTIKEPELNVAGEITINFYDKESKELVKTVTENNYISEVIRETIYPQEVIKNFQNFSNEIKSNFYTSEGQLDFLFSNYDGEIKKDDPYIRGHSYNSLKRAAYPKMPLRLDIINSDVNNLVFKGLETSDYRWEYGFSNNDEEQKIKEIDEDLMVNSIYLASEDFLFLPARYYYKLKPWGVNEETGYYINLHLKDNLHMGLSREKNRIDIVDLEKEEKFRTIEVGSDVDLGEVLFKAYGNMLSIAYNSKQDHLVFSPESVKEDEGVIRLAIAKNITDLSRAVEFEILEFPLSEKEINKMFVDVSEWDKGKPIETAFIFFDEMIYLVLEGGHEFKFSYDYKEKTYNFNDIYKLSSEDNSTFHDPKEKVVVTAKYTYDYANSTITRYYENNLISDNVLSTYSGTVRDGFTFRFSEDEIYANRIFLYFSRIKLSEPFSFYDVIQNEVEIIYKVKFLDEPNQI